MSFLKNNLLNYLYDSHIINITTMYINHKLMKNHKFSQIYETNYTIIFQMTYLIQSINAIQYG